ncbi:hypothetical protein Golob_026490 [Gossypium lobatum]|uniref:Retrotransposon Copia-like N-terminal domain-containing protein n=1 Tax=Gossypium lobatum TaxID=34289 RepID=A0A7J8LVB9_9ROSI|nr:hypothetical protein [Gossypium lobatum]
MEGSSISRLLLLDGLNYTYWEAMMKTFINFIDEKVWRVILIGWEPCATKTFGLKTPKSELSWNTKEEELAKVNSKALYIIFFEVDVQEFKRISKCTTTKEA